MFDISIGLDGEKGQQVLTAVLLTAVVLSVSSGAYIWGKGMIQKSKDQRNFEEMERFMEDLNKNIKGVSRSGGRKEMEVQIPPNGELRINEAGPVGLDNITLSFKVQGQQVALDEKVPIEGIMGSEAPITSEPDVITAHSTKSGDFYHIRFRVYYKNITVEGKASNRIGIKATGRVSARDETTTLIIEDGPTKEYGDLNVNEVHVRIS